MKDLEWLKKPEPQGTPVVYVSIPEGAHLSPETTAALTQLGNSLQQAEKEAVSNERSCLPFECTLNQCHPYKRYPCFVFLTCKIIEAE